MSYHLYTTRGIVIQGLPYREADKYYYLFTKDLGLILASAKSVRKIESKLRFGLNDYSVGEFSLIRGREYWKITGVKETENLSHSFIESPEKRIILARVLSMTQKLVAGEEINTALFTVLDDAFKFLKSFSGNNEEIKVFEVVLMLRILSILGYGQRGEIYDSFVDTTAWSGTLLNDAIPLANQMREEIQKALEASQL